MDIKMEKEEKKNVAEGTDNIKKRVLEVAVAKKVSKSSLCNQIGMTYASFKGAAKNSSLNSEAIAKLITLFPDLNTDWLILGKGSMFKKKK
jgi:hypothetical protein